MYKDLLGLKVSVIVSSRSDNLLEYVGTLLKEDDNTITLKDVDISYLMLNFQKGIFGGNMSQYKVGIGKVIINKKYIISCNE